MNKQYSRSQAVELAVDVATALYPAPFVALMLHSMGSPGITPQY